MKQNQFYKNEALAALKGSWPQAVLAVLVLVAIAMVCVLPYEIKAFQLAEDPTNLQAASGAKFWQLAMLLGSVFVICPLTAGLVNAFKDLLVRREDRLCGNGFRICTGNYLHIVWGNVLKIIFTYLWMLLLIVPGIIKSLSYAMTNYILIDNPELSANEAIERSMAMMRGHKFDLFYLYLSFIGWYILGLFTLGIGYLWLQPYILTAQASFYLDVKNEYENRQNGFGSAAEPAAPAVPAVQPISKVENNDDYMPKA